MASPDPESDIKTLAGEYPIALLPVRIETRFQQDKLRVRIYPDEIFADLHDPNLTDAEYDDGISYWTEAWDPAEERTAWSRLVKRYQATRAAWIAHVLEPKNLPTRPSGAPDFPTVGRRAPSLAHARAELLPTAWTVIAYREHTEVARVTSGEVQNPLTLGFRPDVDDGDPSLVSYDELRLEEELAWTIDFERALAAGMAVDIPLSATDIALGFDRVLVIGVLAPFEPKLAAEKLAALLDSHHYTRGLALVRQGTPTNNTGIEAAGYPPPDDAAYSYAIERDAPLAEAGSDGARMAFALGMPSTVFDHVDGANRREEEAAQAMARALWPCTLGYFLEQIASPHVSPEQIADIRQHTGDFVRGRGPFAAFRVGRVPYGLLPVTSLTYWKSTTTDAADDKLPPLLEIWRQRVLAISDSAAHVGQTGDPDEDLLGVLSLDAATREVRVREVIGPAHLLNLFALLGYPQAAEETARTSFVNGVLSDLGLDGLRPRFTQMTFDRAALRIVRELAANEPLSETGQLTDNYIEWIRNAQIEDLRVAGAPETPRFEDPLLFHLLRQAALLEYARIALDLALHYRAAVPLDRVEVELVRISPGTENRATHWTRFSNPIEGLTGAEDLGKWLLEPSSDVERQPVRDYLATLDVLLRLPTAELDRLTAETLDVCAYRLDAWATSMATRALVQKRATAPEGVYVGAYAWVDDLRPRTTPRPGTAGGFIHAPSATHAAAAAILRSGYLTRTGTERDQVAIDLSSRRVRTALELVDGVRQGQPLGALLGYRFERAVHGAQLDKYIAPFRARFPLGADPGTPPDETSERIPARDVVDGLALRAAIAGATTSSTIPWGNLPTVATQDRNAFAVCLLQLDGDVDATADVMLAESIYQAVQGNTDRASATLAALAGGGTLPEPEIAAVPARATSFTQRVAVLLGEPLDLADGWKDAPRASANDRLDAWLATRLGAPARVRCRISYPDPSLPGGMGEATVSLVHLNMCALDVVALARRVSPEGGGELDARIAWYAASSLGITEPITIAYDRGTASPLAVVTFLELLEVARLLGDVLAGARPLLPVDLTADASGEKTGDQTKLLERATDAREALKTARDALVTAMAAAAGGSPAEINALRGALWNLAAFGVSAAVPASAFGSDPRTRDALLAQAGDALAEANRRIAANADADPSDGGAQLAATFGAEFLVLPTFVAGNRAEVLAAIAGGPSIVGDVYAARRWFEGAARVRAPLGRVRLAALASEATGGGALDFAATQLPLGTRWIGLSFDPDVPAEQPRPGTLSLVLDTELDTTAPAWAGLVFDEWTEAIPATTQLTSLAVNYDAPGAEAAQCVLLAVLPTAEPNWDLTTLLAIVSDAADLGRIRAVDTDLLIEYGLAAPTTYIAANIANDTISNDLAAHRVNEVLVRNPE